MNLRWQWMCQTQKAQRNTQLSHMLKGGGRHSENLSQGSNQMLTRSSCAHQHKTKRDVEDGETRDAASLASAPCAEVLQIDRSHPLPDERFPELTGDLPDGSTSAEG
eukprot:jgi/Botrbrau1/20550/Bobra.145_2s0099.1